MALGIYRVLWSLNGFTEVEISLSAFGNKVPAVDLNLVNMKLVLLFPLKLVYL